MRNLALATLLLVLTGCAVAPGAGALRPPNMHAVTSGERVAVASPIKIIETRGPLALKLEWQLLPGTYVEKYSIPSGRVFASEGRLVQFTSTLGDKQMSYGGFIVLKDRPGMGKLYVAREHRDYPKMLANYLAGTATDEGALVQVSDFDLKGMR